MSWPWTCAGTEGATSRTNRTRCRSLPTILRGCASWLRLEKPAVVGHSMGGIVAFDLAARYPNLTFAVVVLDAAVVLPSGVRAAIPSFLEELRGPGYRDVLCGYVANFLFIPTDARQRKERILQSMPPLSST